MIPEEKSAAVTRALREAFEVTEVEDIRKLTGGPATNPVFRIVVRGSAFLLRINLRAGDLARHYGCMRAAAEAGLAPRVWYTSVEDRISITDYVEAVPFPAADARVRMPEVLRRLHALPPFPEIPDAINTSYMFLMHKGAAVEGFLQKFRDSNAVPPPQGEELFARYTELAAAYPHDDADMVSSHNDLFKPDNILFDGDHVWLVDWEAAFRNDRYADMAVVANMIVSNEAEERAYLEAYFREPPDDYQRARFYLAQQTAHLFYAMAFLFLSAPAGPIDWGEPVPDFQDFQRRFWDGAVNLTDPRAKITFGRIHLERLFWSARQERYHETLRIVLAAR